MLAVLALLFLAVPIVELFLIVQVADGIGVLNTIGLLVLISLGGAWLVRFEGLGVLARVRRELARGEMPTSSLVDGMLILVAGALLLTPGFFTDGVGVLLLLPPSRAVVRRFAVRSFRRRLETGVTGRGGRFGPFTRVVVVDADVARPDDEHNPRRPRGAPGEPGGSGWPEPPRPPELGGGA